MDFIQGEKFKNLANYNNIFYCHNHNVNDFFRNSPIDKFILISHNSDGSITKNSNRYEDADISLMPDNLIRWFGQNVDIDHPKIESIPIGLENSEWFPEIKKIEKIIYKNKETKNIKKLLYINHNINTNIKERLEPYQIFNNSWTTLVQGKNGNGYDDYVDNIYNHKFVLSPRGNGIDTHRLWECLYLGTIPIEKRNLNNRFYQDLPICFVNNWSDINEEFLNVEYNKIKNTKWNLDKLNFSYWRNKILCQI